MAPDPSMFHFLYFTVNVTCVFIIDSYKTSETQSMGIEYYREVESQGGEGETRHIL